MDFFPVPWALLGIASRRFCRRDEDGESNDAKQPRLQAPVPLVETGDGLVAAIETPSHATRLPPQAGLVARRKSRRRAAEDVALHAVVAVTSAQMGLTFTAQ